jgi:hypothetical protein
VSTVDVWVNQLKPLRWYHLVVRDATRTQCGVRADLYGHIVSVGTALSLADKPCPACFPSAARRARGSVLDDRGFGAR